MPESVDFDIQVTHHCEMFNMNEDPLGALYFNTLNPGKDCSIDIKRQEVSTTKDGIVLVVVFYDKYVKVPKPKKQKRKTIESEL